VIWLVLKSGLREVRSAGWMQVEVSRTCSKGSITPVHSRHLPFPIYILSNNNNFFKAYNNYHSYTHFCDSQRPPAAFRATLHIFNGHQNEWWNDTRRPLGHDTKWRFFSISLLLDSRKRCGRAFLVIACPVKKTIITLLAQFVGVARSRFLECTRRPNSTGMHASSPWPDNWKWRACSRDHSRMRRMCAGLEKLLCCSYRYLVPQINMIEKSQ